MTTKRKPIFLYALLGIVAFGTGIVYSLQTDSVKDDTTITKVVDTALIRVADSQMFSMALAQQAGKKVDMKQVVDLCSKLVRLDEEAIRSFDQNKLHVNKDGLLGMKSKCQKAVDNINKGK